MNDKFQILKNMAREYNPEDKSLTKKAIELANDYSKVCKSNFKLQQENQRLKELVNGIGEGRDYLFNKLTLENQQLKEENEELKLQNFNLREDIMIQKKSFPNKEIKDKTFFDLYDMPTYEQLKERIEYLQRSISRKEETIIELQHELVETPKEVELENRIDKAIEYLKRKENMPEWYDTDFMICINILNGGSSNFEEVLKEEYES